MSGGEEGSASVEVKKRKRKKGKKAKKREADADELLGLAARGDDPAGKSNGVECGGDGGREDDEADGDGSVEDEAHGEAKKRKVQTGLGIMSTVPFSSLNISELTMKAIGEMGFQNMTRVALTSHVHYKNVSFCSSIR